MGQYRSNIKVIDVGGRRASTMQTFGDTITSFVPAMFALAIMGTALSIMGQSLSDSGIGKKGGNELRGH